MVIEGKYASFSRNTHGIKLKYKLPLPKEPLYSQEEYYLMNMDLSQFKTFTVNELDFEDGKGKVQKFQYTIEPGKYGSIEICRT